MKNTMKCFGIIALVAVIGFTFVGCGDKKSGGPDTPPDSPPTGGGGSATPFSNTTWEAELFGTIIFDSSNGVSWTLEGMELYKGTYTVSGNTITCTVTWVDDFWGGIMGVETGDTEILTVSPDGTTLTDSLDDQTYTKKE